MILSISSFEVINAVIPDPKCFYGIATSVADAAAGNPNVTRTLLANGLNTFLVKAEPVFSNGPRGLTKNPADCSFSDSWVFDIVILADELFAKASRSLETCVLSNNNLCEKLVSSLELPITFA